MKITARLHPIVELSVDGQLMPFRAVSAWNGLVLLQGSQEDLELIVDGEVLLEHAARPLRSQVLTLSVIKARPDLLARLREGGPDEAEPY
jgi:hypothetical protein